MPCLIRIGDCSLERSRDKGSLACLASLSSMCPKLNSIGMERLCKSVRIYKEAERLERCPGWEAVKSDFFQGQSRRKAACFTPSVHTHSIGILVPLPPPCTPWVLGGNECSKHSYMYPSPSARTEVLFIYLSSVCSANNLTQNEGIV